jgi:hypothetical protein
MENKRYIPQRKLGTALRGFFEHVTSHDEEGVHAALCVVANDSADDPGESMHICSFGAGDPEVLAQIMIMAIESAIEEVSGFEKAWVKALRAKRLQSAIDDVMEAIEAKGMEAVKPEADAIIKKLKTKEPKQ